MGFINSLCLLITVIISLPLQNCVSTLPPNIVNKRKGSCDIRRVFILSVCPKAFKIKVFSPPVSLLPYVSFLTD